jgi:hypothetical protein
VIRFVKKTERIYMRSAHQSQNRKIRVIWIKKKRFFENAVSDLITAVAVLRTLPEPVPVLHRITVPVYSKPGINNCCK